MKLDILIVDLIVVAAVVVPYLLFILMGLREGTGLKNIFAEEAEKRGLLIEEQDQWNHNVIGLDRGRAKVLLLQKKDTGIVTELIDLKQVLACSIVEERIPMKINRRMEAVLQKVALQLQMNNGSFQLINLFDCEETYWQDHELKHAERWNRCINELLPHRRTVNSAA